MNALHCSPFATSIPCDKVTGVYWNHCVYKFFCLSVCPGLFRRSLLNCSTFCNQTWYCHVPECLAKQLGCYLQGQSHSEAFLQPHPQPHPVPAVFMRYHMTWLAKWLPLGKRPIHCSQSQITYISLHSDFPNHNR